MESSLDEDKKKKKTLSDSEDDEEDEEDEDDEQVKKPVIKSDKTNDKKRIVDDEDEDEDENEEDENEENNNKNTAVERKNRNATSGEENDDTENDEDDYYDDEEDDDDEDDDDDSDNKNRDDSDYDDDDDDDEDESNDDDDDDDEDRKHNDDSNYSSDSSNNDRSDDSDYDYFKRNSRRRSGRLSKVSKKSLSKKSKTKNKQKSNKKSAVRSGSSKSLGKKTSSSSSSSGNKFSFRNRNAASSSSSSRKVSSQERRSTASKTINYCEDSNDDEEMSDNDDYSNSKSANLETIDDKTVDDPNVETIEKVLKARVGRVGATGSKTAIYNVEEHGDPNANFNMDTDKEYENQYLIKWQGWSHLHNTWESKETLMLQKVKGMKKLENFLKKEDDIRQSKLESAMSPEDLEYFDCQAEMFDNLLETHSYVERIIADNVNSNQTVDYLCKWEGLPYSECTWEDGELIKKRFSKFVEEYERRQAAQTYPPVNVKTQKALRIRPRFVPLKEKPAYLGNFDPELKLRDYQLDGLNWLANSWCKQNGIILADEMGLGKTIQAISFMSYVFNEHNLYGPFLVVLPLSTMQGWQREFQKWSPEINTVIYLGDGNSRSMIQKYEWLSGNKKIKCNAVLTTYEILLKDKAFFNSVSWAALVVDEAHRLKNEDSLLYRTLIKFDTNHRLLITGTPLQNSLKELWSLLHFIMPEKFDSWEEFDQEYSSVLSDGLRFQDLHRELQPYLLRRVKKDVEKSLPAKVEQILRVEMTKIQKQYYKLILTKNYKELAKGAKGNVNSFLNIMMELKKCSNHIFLIRRDEATSDLEQLIKGSGKLLLLDKLLRRLKETGHRVLIFSQMVRMLDILAEYLQYRRFPFQRLDGSIKGEVRRQALDHFNREDSEDFCFLLSTRAGGLGINLSTADTVIIYDSDWNPQNDLQAQARAHRIGQKNQVNIYRLVSKNSIEEDIVERAKQKMVLDHLVIQRMDTTGRTVLNKTSNSSMPYSKEEINSILKFGAEELFKEKEAVASGAVEKEDEREELQAYDIDEILKRAETREETSHLSASEELLSQFKVANFSTIEDDPIVPTTTANAGAKAANFPMGDSNNDKSWDEIIPEFERRRAEQEEEDEKIKLMNLTLESRRNRPTSFGGKNKNSKNNNSSKQQQQSSDDDEDFVNKSFDSADTSDSEHHRTSKSGGKKKKNSSEHTFKGLNAQEIRRFVRSYRKFPCPLMKIDTIAQDAHLEEKSQACLIEFAKKMQSLCNTALSEYENNHKNNDDDQNDKSNSKKRDRGPIVVINGVTLYAQQILDGEKYFEPLTTIMPQLNDTNNKFQFKTKLKQTYWDCEWTEEDDKSLLKGIYEYGYGNWEWIKADPNLKLTEKILINEQQPQSQSQSQTTQASTAAGTQTTNEAKSTNKLKPQSKHLRTRIDYLIKVIQNQILTEKYGPNWKSKLESNTTRTSAKSTKRTRAADDATPGAEHHQTGGKNSADQANDHSQRAKLKRKLKTATTNPTVHSTQDSAADSDNSETNSETKKKRNNSGEDANHHHHHHHHHHGNTMDHGDQSDSETTASNSKKHHHHPTSHKSDHHHHHHHTNNHQQHSAAAASAAAANDGTKKNPKEKKIILSEKIFEECKNILRPVKKALKNIDMPKEGGNLNERDHIERIKPNILEIGDTINDHLTMYSDPDKIKLWRNYLWVFVAKFTSNWSWERIKNLYKKFSESRDDPLYKPLDFKSNTNNNNNSNSNYKNYDSSNNNNNNNKSFNPTSTSASFSNSGNHNHMYNHGGSQKYYNKYDNNNKNEPFQKSYADKKYSNDSWKNDKNDKHKDGRLNYGKKKDFGHNHRRESDTRDSPMSGGKQLLKSSDYNHQNANYSPVAGNNNNNNNSNYSSKQPYFSQNYDFNAPSSSAFAAHGSASTSAQQTNSMKPYSRSNHGHGQMYPNAAKPHNYTPNENNANMMYESPTSSSMNAYQHHHHQHHHHHSPGGVPPPPPPSSQSSSYMPPNYSDYNRPHFSTSSSNYQYVNPKSTSFQRNLSPSVQNPHDSAKKHRKESHEEEHRKFKDFKETPTSQASSSASNKPSSNQ